MSTTKEYEHISRYEVPSHYFGKHWHEYFTVYGIHRDSDALARSNFTCILRELGGESDTVIVTRASHWAVGWIDTIRVHQDDTARLQLADNIMGELEDYPVVDEDHFSELEYTEACDYWERSSVADRVEAIQSSRSDVSVFAARRPDLPSDDNGALMDYLRN